MKKILFAIAMVCFCATGIQADEARKITDPSKHELTVTIIYNEVSVQQAADLERRVKEQNQDACRVEIELAPLYKADYYITTNVITAR